MSRRGWAGGDVDSYLPLRSQSSGKASSPDEAQRDPRASARGEAAPGRSLHRGNVAIIANKASDHEEGKERQGRQSRSLPSQLIDAKIKALGDWRGEMLARVRKLIKQADPDVVEEVKWRKPRTRCGVPVWEHDGIICTGETYKAVVKLTFAKGAALADPSASSTPASKAT